MRANNHQSIQHTCRAPRCVVIDNTICINMCYILYLPLTLPPRARHHFCCHRPPPYELYSFSFIGFGALVPCDHADDDADDVGVTQKTGICERDCRLFSCVQYIVIYSSCIVLEMCV